ncbi:MAG TPA: hypothetical protein VFD11_02030 [Thiopseudomonas sp.]|nr:hypothetical protein [Thiopseudomonas sp.]
MFELSALISFFGWCAVLNIGLLILAAIILIVFNPQVKALHIKYIAIDQAELNSIYFSFLGRYKLAIIMLNVVPYWALKLMA